MSANQNKISLGDAQRSPCPLASALDLFGDRWTLLILRDLACGKSLFKQFAASPEAIATNILTDRLQRLVQHGLVERVSSNAFARSHEYALTPRGRTLLPILKAIAQWGVCHIADTLMLMKPLGTKGGDR